jgi:hypothetical protein
MEPVDTVAEGLALADAISATVPFAKVFPRRAIVTDDAPPVARSTTAAVDKSGFEDNVAVTVMVSLAEDATAWVTA